jgi:hypothetical protein
VASLIITLRQLSSKALMPAGRSYEIMFIISLTPAPKL